jgi:glutamate dehydrogenase (NADP+)
VSASLAARVSGQVESVLGELAARDPGERAFHQAAREVLASLRPLLERNVRYAAHGVLERLVEPERVIRLRVAWMDDAGQVRVNRAWRVQHSSALGPYKGGLRFHPSVDLSVLKALAFEQTFKNALTGLPLGGAKGGADFDPRGRSEDEVMRFCQALAAALHRHLGPDTDVPAGDLGVGAREIGYLAGMAKKLSNSAAAVFTGKGPSWGGSALRPEATGYGLLYFVQEMLARRRLGIEGMRVAVSGAGNVALHAIEKAMQMGARVVSVSDSAGCAWDPDGFDAGKLRALKELRARRARVEEFARGFGLDYAPGRKPWRLPAEIALPCALQDELDADDARALAAHGVRLVAEGANLPCTPDAVRVFVRAGVAFAPGKAANAGGVAVSGLEMSQNAMRLAWPREEVERRLVEVMRGIHEACVRHGEGPGGVDYALGANVAGFVRVADAMLEQGVL